MNYLFNYNKNIDLFDTAKINIKPSQALCEAQLGIQSMVAAQNATEASNITVEANKHIFSTINIIALRR